MPKYTRAHRARGGAGITSRVRRHLHDRRRQPHLLDSVEDRAQVAATASRWHEVYEHTGSRTCSRSTPRASTPWACKAEIVKAPTPKAMTDTPLEGDAMMILKAKLMAGKWDRLRPLPSVRINDASTMALLVSPS